MVGVTMDAHCIIACLLVAGVIMTSSGNDIDIGEYTK